MVRLKGRIKIMLNAEVVKFSNNEREANDNDFNFMLLNTNLNKELFSFWNVLLENKFFNEI